MREVEPSLAMFSVATVQEIVGPDRVLEGPWRQSRGAQGHVVAGPVVTALNAPGDNLAMHRALETATSGDILLLTGRGSWTAALWGELTSMAAIRKGLAGVVVDGAVRDLQRIDELGIPVWFRTTSPRTATKHKHSDGVNVPVAVGGVSVTPGMQLVADDDGVLVLADVDVALVVDKCRAVESHEDHLREQIAAGRTVYQVADWGAVLVSRRPGGE